MIPGHDASLSIAPRILKKTRDLKIVLFSQDKNILSLFFRSKREYGNEKYTCHTKWNYLKKDLTTQLRTNYYSERLVSHPINITRAKWNNLQLDPRDCTVYLNNPKRHGSRRYLST